MLIVNIRKGCILDIIKGLLLYLTSVYLYKNVSFNNLGISIILCLLFWLLYMTNIYVQKEGE